MSLLALDSRWRRLNDESYACPCCGRSFGGIVDIGFDHPDCWTHEALTENDTETVTVDADFLTPDLCRFEGLHFVHAVLPLPVRGSTDTFFFGVWASVAEADFKAYVQDATSEAPGFEGCAAWLMNDLPGFETTQALSCHLTAPETPVERPRLMVQDGPLAQAQAEGISFDHLLDIYAASGTDIRPHLMG
ncbi:DUF2199 domain-containing protein [Shimia sp. R11_0]|uniref:DUF2199 domain-containing protein n=1 Tax=Shimia sp. R11_0 TaxID=2821096 RepID=UPI001ADC5727|nr:DUF2199 domain-containing protein [Shimia sp. R11_0]MBO9477777.1 DUF2199 domain-containing protein [Shimia sp. R11_0]